MKTKTTPSRPILFLLTVSIAALFFFSVPAVSKTQAFLPKFGGLVSYSFFCACSNTFLLTISPPVPKLLVYAWTPQYNYMQLPRPGVWTTGWYFPGVGICYIPIPYGCASIPNQGMISPWVGTGM